jgi:hypothetical protein
VFDLKINRMRVWPVKGQSRQLARTGQTRSFGVFGEPVEGAQAAGQDGLLRHGVPWPATRFAADENGKGTVTDSLTGLVWLRDAGALGRLNWQSALDACNRLASGSYGLDDESEAGQWRLPNVNELRTLVDYSQKTPALPRPNPFVKVQSSLYWSSTTVASAPKLARFVFIGVGPSVWDHKSVLMNVWPVRDHARGRS